ncbi:MAG: helix-turn-helix domain-containing protein [Vibrio sp.]
MASLNRIHKVLDYIHQHLDQPLSVEQIAAQSCWSRWQLQRVFTAYTGLSVALYIRELKLSRAAELLLQCPERRILDIALSLGFNSEISFSRAFKQFFDQTPSRYRKLGVLSGLRQPLYLTAEDAKTTAPAFKQVRIETQTAFDVYGLKQAITGVLSQSPNFKTQVPKLWQAFEHTLEIAPSMEETFAIDGYIGVIDTREAANTDALIYWASVAACHDLTQVYQENRLQPLMIQSIPTQTYAVLTHQGPVEKLANAVRWLLLEWLPQTQYQAVDGFELERYPKHYQANANESVMEYWLPIQSIEK